MVKDVKKPLIVAKSALTNSAMTVKEDIGCDGIEIQLLNELINREWKTKIYIPIENIKKWKQQFIID